MSCLLLPCHIPIVPVNAGYRRQLKYFKCTPNFIKIPMQLQLQHMQEEVQVTYRIIYK